MSKTKPQTYERVYQFMGELGAYFACALVLFDDGSRLITLKKNFFDFVYKSKTYILEVDMVRIISSRDIIEAKELEFVVIRDNKGHNYAFPLFSEHAKKFYQFKNEMKKDIADIYRARLHIENWVYNGILRPIQHKIKIEAEWHIGINRKTCFRDTRFWLYEKIEETYYPVGILNCEDLIRSPLKVPYSEIMERNFKDLEFVVPPYDYYLLKDTSSVMMEYFRK